jgi:hypothetical protein
MYEKPILVEAGEVTDVVFGLISYGDDLDGSFIPVPFPWETDPFQIRDES